MLLAFDGTWETAEGNSNVFKFFQAVERNAPDGRNLYVEGVGAKVGVLQHLAGGIFGAGERGKVNEAFAWLEQEAETDSNPDIDIVGFSRGAATALDFADRVLKKTPFSIRFLGLFDTVAAFGVANLGFYFSRFTWGHHLELPVDRIRYAFHAMALDEQRPPFTVTRLRGAHEVWFRGVHGDVGGGRAEGLSNITLRWMFRKALAAGVPITPSDALGLSVDASVPPSADWLDKIDLYTRDIAPSDLVHYTVTNYHANPSETPFDESIAQLGGSSLSYTF